MVTRIDDPIVLPEGEKLRTLRDAATYVTGLPKKEAALPEWQAAIEALILVPIAGDLPSCSDWREEGSKPTRRARVRFLTQRKALGPTCDQLKSVLRTAARLSRGKKRKKPRKDLLFRRRRCLS